MKKFLAILILILTLQAPSYAAEDIQNFEIEGISIGDSLLDYMSEDEILKEIEENIDRFSYLKEPNKYVQIPLERNSLIYDSMAILIKNNSSNQYISDKNEKYTIRYISGNIDFINDSPLMCIYFYYYITCDSPQISFIYIYWFYI